MLSLFPLATSMNGFSVPSIPFWPFDDNEALDAIVYDTDSLAVSERNRLLKPGRDEGVILEVGPAKAPSLRLWPDIEACADLAPRYAAITVAGVGSSALGAAAFARNVADGLGEPVLAVVSGVGMRDLAAEALGGFYLFGGLNAVRHIAQTFEPWTSLAPPWLRPLDPGYTMPLARRSADVRALRKLLDGRIDAGMLIGHSKGNLVISEALYALRERSPSAFKRISGEISVVTFGAAIAMPTQIANVIDVMGENDAFGAFNSRPDIAVNISVPGAYHHTNPNLAGHLPVTAIIRDIAGSGHQAP